MRQVHRAGEKAFVDFSGQRPVLCDPQAGELVPVELFTGVLGASSYTYAEACPSQDCPRGSTQPEHMPHAHRAHAEWTPSRLIAWAAKTGPATAQVVTDILASRPHPEQGYRACLGLLRLGQRYGAARLEAACARAAQLGAPRYRTVQNILGTGLDQVPLDDPPSSSRIVAVHPNLRGAAYYADHPAAGAVVPDESGEHARGGQ